MNKKELLVQKAQEKANDIMSSFNHWAKLSLTPFKKYNNVIKLEFSIPNKDINDNKKLLRFSENIAINILMKMMINNVKLLKERAVKYDFEAKKWSHNPYEVKIIEGLLEILELQTNNNVILCNQPYFLDCNILNEFGSYKRFSYEYNDKVKVVNIPTVVDLNDDKNMTEKMLEGNLIFIKEKSPLILNMNPKINFDITEENSNMHVSASVSYESYIDDKLINNLLIIKDTFWE